MMTSDSIVWNPAPWHTKGAAGLSERTIDISSIVQAVVDRGDWDLGNSMVFILYSDEQMKRVAYSYDGSADDAPVLHIEYTGVSANTVVSQQHAIQETLLFKVYPNPVNNGMFSVELNETETPISQIEVIDSMGRIVAVKSLKDQQSYQLQFDASQWPAGHYTVHAWAPNDLIGVEKIVVE